MESKSGIGKTESSNRLMTDRKETGTMTKQAIELTTTTETEEQARKLARQIIDARLAACVQITGPIHSLYRWRGELCEATEYRCTAKSTPQLVDRLQAFVLASHPYDTPEILIAEVQGSDAYAAWLDAETDSGSPPGTPRTDTR